MGRATDAPLPVWEQATYWVVGVTGILYGIYRVHLTSKNLEYSLRYVDTGWDILGGRKDIADYEWTVYTTYYCWQMLPVVCVHFVTSRVLSYFDVSCKTRKLVYAAVGCGAACYVVSWQLLALLLLTTVVFWLGAMLRRVSAVWLLAVACMYTSNSLTMPLMNALQISTSEHYFLAFYLWSSVFLRCTCYAIECVWSKQYRPTADTVSSSSPVLSRGGEKGTKEATECAVQGSKDGSEADSCVKQRCAVHCPQQQPSVSSEKTSNGCAVSSSRCAQYAWPVLPAGPDLLDALVFVFYVPLLLVGPTLTFKSFKEQMESPSSLTKTDCAHVAYKLLTICFWFCFNNAMLHFVFFAAYSEDAGIIPHADKWTIATVAYLTGQFMTNKYVILYGSMKQLARLDGLVLPPTPVCISYIYAYSDMWRFFDSGLYSCLKRYIYIPLGGGQSGLAWKGLAVMATFSFMGYWHGGGYRYWMWAVLNGLEISLEQLGTALQRTSFVQKHLVRRLSGAGLRRVKAALFYPLWLLATVSNMFFLAGPDFAHLYLFNICLQWDSFLVYGLVVYSMIQNAKHLEQLGMTKLCRH